MNENKLIYEECKSDEKWDSFIFNSENKNIFSHSIFLNQSKYEKKKIFLKKGSEIIASYNIFYEKKNIVQSEYIYSSINFRKIENKNKPSIVYEKFLVVDLFKDYLIENFDSGEFTLDYYSNDLRPFMHYNFLKKKDIFTVKNIKYTSLVELSKIGDLSTFSRSNRQQYNYSLNENFLVEEVFDLEFIRKVLKETFLRQKIKNDDNLNNYFIFLSKLNQLNLVRMYLCKKGETKLSFCLFSCVGDKATYLNGGRIEDNNQNYSLTYNLIKSFFFLSKLGIKFVDLEGINDPKRGFWKIGFGGDIKPYYRINYSI